ncbi:MAG: hypothetical protein JXO22_13450 [Phycisphaerae bacterium]|nr:hypothetical protein [Phycisphaerae bacterium]
MAAESQRTSGYRAVLVVLCLLAMGNVPHGMVVCVAGQGHVAIEPAGHDHCADGDAGSDAFGHSILCPYGHAANGDCASCVDIPLSLGAFDHRSAPAASKTSDSGPAACIESFAVRQDHATTLQTFTRCTLLTYHVPLASIILQV